MGLDLYIILRKMKMRSKILLILIIIFHIFILYKLIFFPYPEFFVYPYLTNHGLLPYQQILDQHFPGLMFLPINFDNLGMNNEHIARIWLVMVVVLTQVLIYWSAKNILKSSYIALLVNLLYLIWQPFFEGWVLWIDTFLPLFLIPAFYLTYKFIVEGKKSIKLSFFIGLLLGISVVFKQVVLPLTGLSFIYLLWQKKSIKFALPFLLGFLPPVLMMLFFLYQIGVIKDFWYWTVVFNLTTFAEYGRKLPFLSGLVRVGFVLFFGLSVFFCRDRKLYLTLALFTLGSLMAIYARFDFVHFQPALPFILISTVVGMNSIKDKIYFKGLVLIYLAVIFWWMFIFYKGHLVNKVMFFDTQTKEIAAKVSRYTKPGDKIFIFGTVPHIYQMTNTMPAGDVFVFQFPWFLRVTEDRLLEGLKEDKPRIVVSDRTVEIEGSKIVDFAKKLDTYIQQNYRQIDQVGDTKILRRL